MAEHIEPGEHPLFERDLELDLLLSLASEVADGASRIAVITGEAGVGKSRLCLELAERLPADWPRSVLHRASPEPRPDGPALVVVEDLHDAEPDTGDRIRALLTDGPPVLVLCTHRLGVDDRTASSRSAAFRLLRTPGVIEIHLTPLSEEATLALARRLGSDVDPDDATRLHERTGGNPFFIEELARTGDTPVPWTITASVMDRVGTLPAEARIAVEALAVAGGGVSRSVLDQVAGASSSVGFALVDRQLAVTTGQEIRLRHEIVGEVVAAGLAERRVRALHRGIADALVDQPSPPAHRVADHLLAAGDHRAAASWALAGAREAVTQRRFGRAVQLFRIALDDDIDLPGDVLERAAVAAAQAGRTGLAERWAKRAEAAYRAAGDAHRATALWLDPSLVYVRRPPIDLDDLSPDAAARLAVDATALARAGHTAAARDRAIEALAIAEEQGDSAAGGAAALALLLAGEAAEAVTRLESLRLAAMLADEPLQEARRSFDLARCASALGDQTAAETHQRAGLAAMARVPESGERPLSQAGLAALLATSGRLEDAEALAEPLLEGPNAAAATIAGLPLTMVDLAHGRLDRARRWLAAIAPYRSIAGPDLFGVVLAQEALLHLRCGDLDRAAGVLDDAESWIGGRLDISRIDRLEVAIRVAMRRQDAAALDRLADDAGRLAQLPEAGPGLHGIAALATGFRESMRGAHPLALAHLETAARQLATCPRLVQAADAWCDAALAALAVGDHGRASAALDAAVVAGPAEGPVHDRVAAILARSAAARSASGSGSELERLTPRERSIIRLVAAGLTNKEIGAELHLSDKTVRNQLSLLFAKLGIERRSQAAAFAVRHGLAIGPEGGG